MPIPKSGGSQSPCSAEASIDVLQFESTRTHIPLVHETAAPFDGFEEEPLLIQTELSLAGYPLWASDCQLEILHELESYKGKTFPADPVELQVFLDHVKVGLQQRLTALVERDLIRRFEVSVVLMAAKLEVLFACRCFPRHAAQGPSVTLNTTWSLYG